MSTKSYSGNVSAFNSRTVKSWNSDGSFAGLTTTPSSTSVAIGGTRTGVSNPEYRAQIARGECATTTFSGSKTSAWVTQCTYHLRRHPKASNDHSADEYYGVYCPGFFNPASFTLRALTVAQNRASQQFFKKARKAQRNLQSGVFIGELLETLRLIRDPAIAMRSLVDVFVDSVHSRMARALRSTSKRAASSRRNVNIGNAIGDSWLEMAFGWAPLASDVKSGAEALARILEASEHEFTPVTGIGNDEANTLDLDQFNQIPGVPAWFREQWRTRTQATSKVYGRVRVGVPGSPDCRPMAALGLTLGDVVPTIWELIPWTFLIDYFSNIGDVIDACCFPRSDIVWTTRTDRQVTRKSNLWTYDQPQTLFRMGSSDTQIVDYAFCANSSSVSERSTVYRSEIVVPLPSLEFELPMRIGQKLNIAGLFLSRSRKPIGL